MMKKIRELLKEKRWRWTAGGIACLAGAAMIFALGSGLGVQASINLGGVNVDLSTDGNIYLISNQDELKALGNATATETENKTFRLASDIEVLSMTGPVTGTFAGTFDGNGHVITYKDINIEVTDGVATKESKAHGLLFGTLTTDSTVQNLIIDIADEDAFYVRNVKNAPVESGTNIAYEENYGPLFTGTVSGLTNVDEASNIHTALQDPGITVSGNTLTQNYQEKGTKVTSYTEDTNPGTDYFGVVCGANHGEITQVYVTGNQVNIARNELTSQNYSKKNQKGYRTETYNYTKELVSSEESTTSDEFSLLGTAYINDSKSYDSKHRSMSVSVSAPKAYANGKNMVYTILIENTGEIAYDSVSLKANIAGKWGETADQIDGYNKIDYSINQLAANSSKTVYFSCETPSEGNSISRSFEASATAEGRPCASVKVDNVNTSLFKTGEKTITKIEDELKIDVRAPKTWGSDAMTYTVRVTNIGTSDYFQVDVTASNGATTSESGGIAKGEYKEYQFTYTPTETEISASVAKVQFSVNAKLNSGDTARTITTENFTTTLKNTTEATTVHGNSAAQNIELSVSAPKAVVKDDDILYTITVTNTGEVDYDSVSVDAGVSGSWGDTKDSVSVSGSSYTIVNLAKEDSKTVYFSCTTPSSGTTLSRTFTISAFIDGSVHATAKAENVTTALFNPTDQTSTKTEKGLTITVEAPEQWGKNAIPYTVTIKNNGSMTYHNVSVAANKGQAEGASNASIAPGETTTFHFSYTPGTSETMASVNFSVAAVLHNGDDAKNITTDNITTTVHDSTDQTQSSAVNGIYMSVSAPQVVFNQSGTEVQYTITLTNQDAITYSSVNLTSTEAGVWNGSGSAKTTQNDTLAANEMKVIPFTYQVDEASNISSLDLDFSATTYTGNAYNRVEKTNTSVTDVKTAVYKGKKLSDVAEFSNEIGLKAKLDLENDKIYAGGGRTLSYTLTLENDNELPVSGVVLSKDITVSTDLTGWMIESKTGDFTVGTNQILKAGESVVLKKDIPVSLIAGNTQYEHTESLTIEGKLTTKAYSYTYAGYIDSEFVENVGEVTYSGDPVISGNYLYAGAVSGKSTGTIQEVKQTVKLSGTEAANEFVIAGIAADAENVGTKWSDI